MNIFHDLYQHMHWADAAVWHAILETPGTADNSRIRDLTYHIHLVQHAFLHLWTRTPWETPKPEQFAGLEELMDWGRSWHQDVGPFLATLDPAELPRRVMVPWVHHIERMLDHPPEQTTLEDTLLQVAVHTAHHRGQLNSLLREAGGAPPLVDMIMWVWRGRPVAAWPVPA